MIFLTGLVVLLVVAVVLTFLFIVAYWAWDHEAIQCGFALLLVGGMFWAFTHATSAVGQWVFNHV